MTAARALKVRDANAPNPPEIEAAFQAAPDTMITEILDGELHTVPRPTRLHARTASALGGELYAPFWRGIGGPGGWEIPFAPEIHLGPKPDKVVPDLAGWRRERLSDEVTPGEAPRYYDVAPDWVCEVLGSGTKGVLIAARRCESTGARAFGTCGSSTPSKNFSKSFSSERWAISSSTSMMKRTPSCGRSLSMPSRFPSALSGEARPRDREGVRRARVGV